VNAFHRWLLPVAFSVALVGCGKESTRSAAPPDKLHEVNGTVLAVDVSKPSVKLDHEDIPGIMKAMKMTFGVESPKVLDGIQPGDHVRGHLRVEGGKFTIVHLEKH
jgi:protein SCO1/2